MTEYGRVVKTEGDRVTVSFLRRGECDRCMICTVGKENCATVETQIKNTLSVNVGDCVKVKLYDKKIRLGSVLIYLLPLALTALGAGLGYLANIAVSVIIALLGLIVGLAFAVPIDVCVLRKDAGHAPRLVCVCSEEEFESNKNKPQKSESKTQNR